MRISSRGARPEGGTLARWGAALAVPVAAFFLAGPLAKYSALRSDVFDLGLFQSSLHSAALLGEWQRAFLGHAQPFMLPFAAAYGLLGPEFAPYALLFEQSLLLLLPALVLWRRYGPLAAFAYFAYMPVWANAFLDFHFDHLAVPLLLAFYMATQARRAGWAVAAALALMMVKEPFALQTVGCGAYLVLLAAAERRERRWHVAGAALVVAGAAYFWLVSRYVFPYFTPDRASIVDGGAFGWLGSSPGEIAWTALGRPGMVLAEVLATPGKLAYLAVVFGSLAFVPLLRPIHLVPALPLLAIAMLSRLDNYYSYANHYTAGLIVPVVFAFVHGVRRAERIGERARLSAARMRWLLCAWILGVHALLAPSPLARLFWSDKVWSYTWRAYVPTDREAMMKAAIDRFVPADPELAVSAQNTVNWGRLAHRRALLAFPMGIEAPVRLPTASSRSWAGFADFVRSGRAPPEALREVRADYVVLDLKRPYFVDDRGCEWLYGRCRDATVERRFLGAVAAARSRYEPVFERDGFAILKRRP